jgi:hypothetical protein
VHQVVAVLVGHVLVVLFVAIILSIPTPESNLGNQVLIDIAAGIMTLYFVFKVWYLGVESMRMQKHIHANAILDYSELAARFRGVTLGRSMLGGSLLGHTQICVWI